MTQLSFAESKSFSKIFIDYVEESKELEPFISFSARLENIQKAIAQQVAQQEKDPNREVEKRRLLHDALQQQYSLRPTATACITNIESLLNQNTFTITTGHQLGIFGGELYFLYKIITTIRTCEEAKKLFPEYNFVPVFWMASEDHDFEEINHVHVQGTRFEWKNQQLGGACGERSIQALPELIKNIEAYLGDLPASAELISLLNNAYQVPRTLAEASFHFVNALFEQYGLLVLEPNQIELKNSFASIVQNDIFEEKSFQSITETTKLLTERGYTAQVHPREINFFFLDKEYRERIVKNDNGYGTVDGKHQWSKQDLEHIISKEGNRISPNVCMRPLYQEFILPNLAYIGGPGEIAYWLQLKKNFEAHKLNFPLLFWRNSYLLINQNDHEKFMALGFNSNDIFHSSLTLERDYVQRMEGIQKLSLSEQELALKSLVTELQEKMEQVDRTLKATLGAFEKKTHNAIKVLEKKMLRAAKRKFEIQIGQIKSLKNKYFPDNKLQERHENFIHWYANCGNRLIKVLFDECKPLIKDITTVKLTFLKHRKED